MLQKFITGIAVKSYRSPHGSFKKLQLSKGSGLIEISSKESDSGLLWTTKVTAKLIVSHPIIDGPCIVQVLLRDHDYIIGSLDRPAQPTIKEIVLIEFTLTYDSVTKPEAIKKVLSFM